MSENNKATFDCDLPSIDGPISHREALALYAQENVALRAEIAALNEQIAQLMAESEHRAKYESEIAALREAVRWFYEEGDLTKDAHDAIDRARVVS